MTLGTSDTIMTTAPLDEAKTDNTHAAAKPAPNADDTVLGHTVSVYQGDTLSPTLYAYYRATQHIYQPELAQQGVTTVDTTIIPAHVPAVHFAVPPQPQTVEPALAHLHQPYPLTHFTDPWGHLDNVRLDQQTAWENIPGGKLIAHAALLGCPTPETSKAQNNLKMKIFNASTGATTTKASAPIPSIAVQGNNRPPHASLLYDIPAVQLAYATQQRVLNRAEGTLFIYSPEPIIPTFLGTVRNYSIEVDDAVTAGNIIQRCLDRADFDRNITPLVMNNPAWIHMPARTATQEIRDSLRVEVVPIIGPGPTRPVTPYINVFMRSPTPDPYAWRLFRASFKEIDFMDLVWGPGEVVAEEFTCGLCHGRTHPTGLCPFPLVQSWITPALAQPSPANDSPAMTGPAPAATAQAFTSVQSDSPIQPASRGRGRGGLNHRGWETNRGRSRGRGWGRGN